MPRYLKIDSLDNVAVALTNLTKGENLDDVTLLDDIKQGHKFALKDIKQGENIIKYGYPIGHASKDIKQGQHVHSFNLETNLSGELEYVYSPKHSEVKPAKERFVKVYKRKFNKVGIRNNLMIVPLVGCINASAERIKSILESQVDKNIVDEIIVARHPYGCSQLGDDHLTTVKVLQSLVKHPNNGGILVLSLGCENNQLDAFKASLGEYDTERVRFLRAQDVNDEVEEGVKLCLELIERMKLDKREETSIKDITIGLKCGGSDGFSGNTAFLVSWRWVFIANLMMFCVVILERIDEIHNLIKSLFRVCSFHEEMFSTKHFWYFCKNCRTTNRSHIIRSSTH